MQNLHIILFLILCMNVTLFSSNELIKSIEVLANNMFTRRKPIHVIYDDNDFVYFILQSILSLERQIVIKTFSFLLKNITDHIVGKTTHNYYIIAVKEFEKLESYVANMRRYKVFSKPHEKILIFIEGRKERISKIISEASRNSAINIIGIQLQQNTSTYYSLDNMKNWKFYNFEGTKFKSDDYSDIVKVISFYHNEVILQWNANKIITEDELGIFKNEIRKFRLSWKPNFASDHQLKVGMFNCPPFLVPNDQGQVYDGIEYMMLKEIAASWSVKYVLVNHVGGRYSDLWQEIVNMTVNGTTDMAACSQWLVSSSVSKVDYTLPYLELCSTFLVPKPELLSKQSLFFRVLPSDVWTIICTSILVLWLLLNEMKNFRERRVRKTFTLKKLFPTRKDMVLPLLDILRLTTSGPLPSLQSYKWSSVRILIATLCLYAVLLATYYSAGITSSLTTPSYSNPIITLQDMVDNKIKWTKNTDMLRKLFLESNKSVLKELAHLSKIETSMEGFKALSRTKKYAFIVKTISNKYVTDTELIDNSVKKHLKVLKQCFGRFPSVFLFRRYSPYTSIFNKYITKFTEHGLIDHWIATMVNKANKSYMENFYRMTCDDDFDVTLGLKEILGIVYLFVAGNLLAFLVFLCEVFIKK